MAALSALALSASAVAAPPQQAHVHGLAELTLALEGSTLEMEFSSPAMDIVGFEHQAANAQQVQAVEDAESRLREGAGLFTFGGTQCVLQDVAINLSAVQASDRQEDAAHRHHEHDDDHDSGSHHHDDSSHSDISAHYQYRCADTASLESLRVGNGALPFGIEEIKVMWVSERGQGTTVLTAANQLIEFTDV